MWNVEINGVDEVKNDAYLERIDPFAETLYPRFRDEAELAERINVLWGTIRCAANELNVLTACGNKLVGAHFWDDVPDVPKGGSFTIAREDGKGTVSVEVKEK